MNARINNFIHTTYYRAHKLSLEYQVSSENENNKSLTARRLRFLDFLYGKLDSFEPEKEQDKYDLFLKGVRGYIGITKSSEVFKSFVLDIIKTGKIIRYWMAETQSIASHVRSVCREKSLESALTKVYNKSEDILTPQIKDSFGITWIFHDNNIHTLYQFSNYFVGITTGRNRTAQRAFVSWLSTNKNFSDMDKDSVTRVLTSNLDIENRGKMHGHTELFDPDLHPQVRIPVKP